MPHAVDITSTAADNYTVSAWVNAPSPQGSWGGVVTKSRFASPWYGMWISSANRWVYAYNNITGVNADNNLFTVPFNSNILTD